MVSQRKASQQAREAIKATVAVKTRSKPNLDENKQKKVKGDGKEDKEGEKKPIKDQEIKGQEEKEEEKKEDKVVKDKEIEEKLEQVKDKTRVTKEIENIKETDFKSITLPEIVLHNQANEEVNLESLVKDNTIVIFTYPKASTPGCTKQVQFFNEKLTEFTNNDIKVFGLSKDPVSANLKFHSKYNLNYPLLSDPKSELIKFLGAFKGDTKGAVRSCFVLKKGGKQLYSKVQVGPQPSVDWAVKKIEEL
ncbi:thioredoxin-like protein, partial [Neoconidiobolus thromboides FSU 785]